MRMWKVAFRLDNNYMEQIVSALTVNNATDFVKKQFAGHKVSILYCISYNG